MISIKDDPAIHWQNTRAVYALYGLLARELRIEMHPCPELEAATGLPSPEAAADAARWMQEFDPSIPVHQLRHFLQTSEDVTEDALRQLLLHHLGKTLHSDQDRDKVDFMVVQFFSQHVPSPASNADLSLAAVGLTLEPILGVCEVAEPEWVAPLDDLLASAKSADSLNELLTSRIIERGREIKMSAGEAFFEPSAIVAFARFGFLIRRRFFRLMHQDLSAILDGLRELESRGVTRLDCRKAQFAGDEPIHRLLLICQSWKVMFHAEYSSGQPLCILADLRTAVEAALAIVGKSDPRLAANSEGPAASDGSATSEGDGVPAQARAAAAAGVAALTGASHEFEAANLLQWDAETAANQLSDIDSKGITDRE